MTTNWQKLSATPVRQFWKLDQESVVVGRDKEVDHLASSMRNAGEVIVDIVEATPLGYLALTWQEMFDTPRPKWANGASRRAFTAMGRSMDHGLAGVLGGGLGWLAFYPIHLVAATGNAVKDVGDTAAHAIAAGIDALR